LHDVLAAIGNTPLVRLTRLAAATPHVAVYGKAEFLNPGGSVKDRPARAMILDGLSRGLLRPGKTILEATSGNTGIADAMLGAALGFPVLLCLPANAGPGQRGFLKAFGAQLVLTSPLEGTDGAARRAREMVAAEPDRFFYPDQYANDENWRAHFTTTGPEIVRDTAGRVTHFVAGSGTSGTFVGTSRALKAAVPGVSCVWMQPSGPLHGFEGMKHYATTEIPAIYDATLADATLEIETEEAWEITRRLAREEGLFVGPSSGGNVAAALRLAATLPKDREHVVVTILCDGGAKYLGERFWEG